MNYRFRVILLYLSKCVDMFEVQANLFVIQQIVVRNHIPTYNPHFPFLGVFSSCVREARIKGRKILKNKFNLSTLSIAVGLAHC